ncbi:response regulator [Fuchsiella alkaliacetigena]|uniref:response regulator n=1 Tax=Fuchsiella alkaliacetigena TaxID=957042 RepID=UPI00200B94CF|nr:response regulator [Fuchsiella alkaliacetigena]MCK8825046.1 response regulator [Fuchsiella alkaliacetigena]
MVRVLVIDDEKNIRKTLSSCLEVGDYEVETAVNGEDGISKFSEQEYDLVLLDMKMPGMDGIETLKKLKKIDSKIEVIMITAYGTIETAVESMKLGACDYLRKPFSPTEIRNIVDQILARKELDEEELVDFGSYVEFAKSCINQRQYDRAVETLREAISIDSSQPEPFNLLGVLLELDGKVKEAQKQYRAALALDPTYKPAQDNLERTSKFDYKLQGMNLGEDYYQETDNKEETRNSK